MRYVYSIKKKSMNTIVFEVKPFEPFLHYDSIVAVLFGLSFSLRVVTASSARLVG